MQNLRLSRSKIINFFVFLSILFVSVFLVRELEFIISQKQNNEIRSLVTSIGISIIAYLLKATDANRNHIQLIKNELELINERLSGLASVDEKQKEKLIELDTQLATQEKYYWLKEKVERLLDGDN